MKNVYLLLLLSLLSSEIHAQDPEFEWATSIGATQFWTHNRIASDASDNVFISEAMKTPLISIQVLELSN